MILIRDYQLRYRTRFVEKSLETRVQDAVVSSLVFDVEDNPMDLEVVTGTPVPASEERWILPAEISFPINKIAMLPEGDDYVSRIVLFVASRDSEGREIRSGATEPRGENSISRLRKGATTSFHHHREPADGIGKVQGGGGCARPGDPSGLLSHRRRSRQSEEEVSGG